MVTYSLFTVKWIFLWMLVKPLESQHKVHIFMGWGILLWFLKHLFSFPGLLQDGWAHQDTAELLWACWRDCSSHPAGAQAVRPPSGREEWRWEESAICPWLQDLGRCVDPGGPETPCGQDGEGSSPCMLYLFHPPAYYLTKQGYFLPVPQPYCLLLMCNM